MLLVFEHCGAPQPCPTAKEEEEIRMSSRPLSVSVAAILLALISLMNFPGPWWYLVPEAVEVTPMFVIYSGIVLGVVGLVAAVGLWMLKNVGLLAHHCSLCAQHPFERVWVSNGATWRTQSPYRSIDHRLCPYTRAGSASGHAACFGNCRPTFACKVRRVFRESAVPEARFPRRPPFYSVRQKR